MLSCLGQFRSIRGEVFLRPSHLTKLQTSSKRERQARPTPNAWARVLVDDSFEETFTLRTSSAKCMAERGDPVTTEITIGDLLDRLITLWGTFQDSKNLYMVMDFIEGGELFSLLRKSQVGYPSNLASTKKLMC